MKTHTESLFSNSPEVLKKGRTVYSPRYGQNVYDDLIAYLAPTDIKRLEEQLISIEVDKQIADKITQGAWVTLFKDNFQQFPQQALLCLKNGLISDLSYSTSQLFFNVWNAHEEPVKIISVFNNLKIVNQAEKMIDATMKIFSPSRKKWLIENENKKIEGLSETELIEELSYVFIDIFLRMKISDKFGEVCNWSIEQRRLFYINCLVSQGNADQDAIKTMENDALIPLVKQYLQNAFAKKLLNKYGDELLWTKEQRTVFYMKLLKLPVSEQCFLLFDDDSVADKVHGNKACATNQLNFKLGFNELSRVCVKDKPMRMMPSRGMMQAYLEAVCEDVPRPVFRFSFSTIIGLHNTLKANGRDLFQYCVLLSKPYPSKIHSYPAFIQYSDAELHDFYHQMRVSFIPLRERKMLNDCADLLLACAGSKPIKNQFARAFALEIIDMDHFYYSENFKKSCLYIKIENYKVVD